MIVLLMLNAIVVLTIGGTGVILTLFILHQHGLLPVSIVVLRHVWRCDAHDLAILHDVLRLLALVVLLIWCCCIFVLRILLHLHLPDRGELIERLSK